MLDTTEILTHFFNCSTIGTYNDVVREQHPVAAPTTAPQGPLDISQRQSAVPVYAGDHTTLPVRASVMPAYSQELPRTGLRDGDAYHHVAALSSPAYTQISGVDRVTSINELSHEQYLSSDAFTTPPDYHNQGYSPSWYMDSSSPSRSPQSAPASSVSEARHQQLVASTIHPSHSANSTYSALQDAVSLPVQTVQPIQRRHPHTNDFR